MQFALHGSSIIERHAALADATNAALNAPTSVLAIAIAIALAAVFASLPSLFS